MKKPIVRIIALVIVFMLVLGLFSGTLAMFAGAVSIVNFVNGSIAFVNTGTNTYTVTFDFTDANVTGDVTDINISLATNTDINFGQATATLKQDSKTKSLFHATVKNAVIPTRQTIYFEFTAQYTITSAGDGGGNGYASGYVGSGSSSNDEEDQRIAQVITADTTVSKTLTTGNVSTGLKITFNFLDPGVEHLEGEYSSSEFTMPLDSSFGWSHNTKLTITRDNRGDFYKAALTNVSYNGGSAQNLSLTLLGENFAINVPIPNKYFKKGSSEDEDTVPTSDIVVQSTIVRNAEGQKLGKIDKNSGRFTVEVQFYDIGLRNESNASIDAAKKYAFITSPAGFKLHTGSSGKVERVASSAEYPRFKATFENVESTGTANTLNFRVQYDFAEYAQGVKGEAVATLFQISSESSEEETEAAPLKPNVIVQEYSYGTEAIVAGSEFNLDMVFANTSRTVAVENVVMTIEPASGFYIAAASNTVYFPSMGAGESKPYSVALRAMPSQNAGVAGQNPTDYSVNVKFTYQYLMNKKDYGEHSTSVKIAIPVEQLDRFTVDEITDYSQYLTLGYEGYLTVPITNKGKSATMNISGTVESASGAEFTAPPAHYGNLEAGKSATLNISITINTPGEFTGEAVILYEDENMNQKEMRQPFTIMVDAPFVPPPEMPEMPETPQEDSVSPYSVALFVIGGLMLASPAALILMKRIKTRGNEDIDEDF